MESKSSTGGTSSSNLNRRQIVLKEELQSLLRTVKNIQPITTYEEVLDGLKVYIWQKKLFDPQNPRKICCKDDELGSVIGAKEFTIFDVKFFLQKLVFPVDKNFKGSEDSDLLSVTPGSSKRKCDEYEDCGEKKICGSGPSCQPPSPMFLCIPPSPVHHNSSSESVESIQGYETAFVKDTSDDSLSVDNDYLSCNEGILAVEETFDVEYEVETDSSCSYSSDTDSIDSEINFVDVGPLDAKILAVICRTDSDIEFFADDSSEAESEIPESDKWECKKCQTVNDPTMRYCSKCWDERLEWLPDKNESPKKRKRKKSKKELDAVKQEGSEIKLFDTPSSSQLTLSSSQETQSSQENSSSNLNFQLCIICCDKPASASIVHGTFAHLICCYVCALKLQKQKKRCPLCRRTIKSVVNNFT